MKKLIVFSFFFLLISIFISSQGIQILSDKISENIETFFADKHQVKYSIIRFENYSSLSDLELQRFYGLIITNLERSEVADFKDILTGFNNGKGNFDLNRINEVNHFVTIKLINNMGKLGAGVIIYNRNLNRIVSVRYYEEQINKREIELLSIKDPGVSSREYFKVFDLRVNKNLLNIVSCDIKGTEYLFFLLTDRIDIYTIVKNSISKKSTRRINWEKPYFPSIKNEGNLFLFKENSEIFFAAGSNFSKYSYVYKLEGSELKSHSRMEFSIADVIKINDIRYIAGFNYNFGMNFYKGKLFLKQFKHLNFNSGETFAKTLPDFYSAAFYKEGDDFRSIFLIDLDYNMRVFSDTMNEAAGFESKFGSTHAISGNVIAVSDHVDKNDRLRMLKIGNIMTPLFNIRIKGEIKLIKNGILKGYKGFWIIVENNTKGIVKLNLQFWRKNID